jgi:hypothetical protein
MPVLEAAGERDRINCAAGGERPDDPMAARDLDRPVVALVGY